MTDKEFGRLCRRGLLQLLVAQGKDARQLQEEFDETSRALAQAQESNERLKAKLDEKDALIDKLKNRLDQKDARIRKLREDMEAWRNSRQIQLEEAGSIAAAALRLNGIFEAAQQASDPRQELELYLCGAGGTAFEGNSGLSADGAPGHLCCQGQPPGGLGDHHHGGPGSYGTLRRRPETLRQYRGSVFPGAGAAPLRTADGTFGQAGLPDGASLRSAGRKLTDILQKRINCRFLTGRQRTGVQYYVNSVICEADSRAAPAEQQLAGQNYLDGRRQNRLLPLHVGDAKSSSTAPWAQPEGRENGWMSRLGRGIMNK